MNIARHVRVTGRVQGVFFRQWTCDRARELGVTGWVRNCDDGSVEAHVEGEEGAVGQLIEQIRQGPPAASVANLQVEKADPVGSASFDLHR